MHICFELSFEQVSFGAEKEMLLEITGMAEDDNVTDLSLSAAFLFCCGKST